jgi:3-deoxy-7-phosphoheptulonate synthase
LVSCGSDFTAAGAEAVVHTGVAMSPWSPDSWTRFDALQQPTYDAPDEVAAALETLAALPPLVTSWEIEALRRQLAEAQRGERFVLQGGDCAEHFDDCRAPVIVQKLKILLQMALILTHGLGRRVVRVARLAGQYAKPRSAELETREGVTLPAYRGDLVNALPFDPAQRRPDPRRLVAAYERSALTLNFLRAMLQGGFGDVEHADLWQLDLPHRAPSKAALATAALGDRAREALRWSRLWSESAGLDPHRAELYTCHEALHLPYEQALTRRVPRRTGYYNLGTHLPWVGMRTALPGSAHLEYLRGLANPIALKVGPALDPAWLPELLDLVDPERLPGRVTLIHRMGVDELEARLPPLLAAVRRSGRPVLWVCDPMHGNTRSLPGGLKTRHLDDIVGELQRALRVHRAEGSQLGGVHLEMTGEEVTECVGGTGGLTDADLQRAYRSQVDPRLNYEQALELAMLIAEHGAG